MPRLLSPAGAAVPCVLLLVGVAACGGRAPAASAAPRAIGAECPDSAAASADTIAVGVAQGDADRVEAGCAGVVLDVRAAAGDQRDQIDRGADVVVTRDPAAVAYAEKRPGLSALPLAWDRTYLLVVPGRPVTWLADSSARFRASLARDAVAGAARGAEGPYRWEQGSAPCPAAAAASRPADSLLTYRGDDRTARELAERLVALAAARGVRLRATPRGAPGRDAAGVIAIPRALAPGTCEPALADATIVPLVDTRATAIVRDGRARAVPLEGGGVRILPPPPDPAPAE